MAVADRSLLSSFKRFIFNLMITKRLVLPVQECPAVEKQAKGHGRFLAAVTVAQANQ
jgi:hypothetical protein